MIKVNHRSHIDKEKLSKVPSGCPFEYKDVVKENFPVDGHTEDGKVFKAEVEQGIYDNVEIRKDTGSHILYKKL